MTIAIVTDSTAYLTDEQYREHHIYRLPLSVIIDGKVLKEEEEINSTDFFDQIRDDKDLPTSSQPTIGEIESLFHQLSKDYDAVISIHLSSKISGTYQTVSSISHYTEDIAVYPYDSGISCSAQGYFALEAARMAQNGANVEDIFERFEEMQQTLQAYFVVDDLKHLVRGGRLSNGAAQIGTLLKIKPILYFEQKQIVIFEKIRTSKKALKRIESLLEEDVDKGYPIVSTIIHANAEDKAVEWREQLEARFPSVTFNISYFGPVIGTHLGEGALGMTWVKDFS
ncbi:DegV family protein [Pisciglobus halotolerans]|uniref:EDD domain protein, DegV family n=1 Tax=Pisciglobus halotolerans TaxID=745365 RepID=A0A1I3BKW1_9LACT|nr:DegV family protein [Pisciglobus halotolerans]SFH62883.1 EDD domain protein, DegV family [Pisciglobus halotolerans]